MKKYLLGSMTNNLVQFEIRFEANSTICKVSEEMLPKSGAHFESENVWKHFDKEN
jgi:hypothetical protein